MVESAFVVDRPNAPGVGKSRLDEVHRCRAHPLRVHGQARRSRLALHALGHRARRHGGPRPGRRAPGRGLRVRGLAQRRVSRPVGARAGRRLRPRGRPPRRGQDLPRRPACDAAEPALAALGPGQVLWRAAVRRARARQAEGGARLLRRHIAGRDDAGRIVHGRRAARFPRAAMRALSGRGRAGERAPRRARRGAGHAGVPVRRIPHRTAPTGRERLQGRDLGPHAAGAGAHGHRQDGGHALSAAEGDALPAPSSRPSRARRSARRFV
jgi:hypothetical protein